MGFIEKVAGWLGSNAGGLFSTGINAATSIYNTKQNNANIDKQLAAQKEENEKIRKYNRELAEWQNAQNVKMWNMQNAYNSPVQQKARLIAAGLNPDMMYGGSGVSNTSTSSPDMTSGAAATPMDWSALGSKRTIGSAIMDSLAIEQARANIRKTNAEAGVQETAYEEAKRRFGLNFTQKEYDKLSADLDYLSKLSDALDKQISFDEFKRDIDKQWYGEEVKSRVQGLQAKYNLTDKQFELLKSEFDARVAQQEAAATSDAVQAALDKYGVGFLKDFLDIAKSVYDLYNAFKGNRKSKDGFRNMHVDGNVVTWD